MEVNNNDPNNNDPTVLDLIVPHIAGDMGQGGSGISRPPSADPEDSERIEDSDDSYSNDSYSNESPSYYYNRTDKTLFDYDGYSDCPSDYGLESNNLSDELNNSTYTDVESEENMSEEICPSSESLEEVEMDEEDSNLEENQSNNTMTMSEEYHAIKKIVSRRLNDKVIFKYLHLNENHDNRLMATMWDLMHMIKKPKSKKEKLNASLTSKKQKSKTDNIIMPIPGKPSCFTMGSVKLTPTEMQNLNRKDYKRLPKRAPMSSEGSSMTEVKKRKLVDYVQNVPLPSTSNSKPGPSKTLKLMEEAKSSPLPASSSSIPGPSKTLRLVEDVKNIPFPASSNSNPSPSINLNSTPIEIPKPTPAQSSHSVTAHSSNSVPNQLIVPAPATTVTLNPPQLLVPVSSQPGISIPTQPSISVPTQSEIFIDWQRTTSSSSILPLPDISKINTPTTSTSNILPMPDINKINAQKNCIVQPAKLRVNFSEIRVPARNEPNPTPPKKINEVLQSSSMTDWREPQDPKSSVNSKDRIQTVTAKNVQIPVSGNVDSVPNLKISKGKVQLVSKNLTQWRDKPTSSLPATTGPTETVVRPTEVAPPVQDKSNTHQKVSSKQLAGFIISACQNANLPVNNIIKPASFALNVVPEQEQDDVVIVEPGPSTSNATRPAPPVAKSSPEIERTEFSEQELKMDTFNEMNKLVHKDIFDQLTVMFEKVRREYILKLCSNFEKRMSRADMLNRLIDILLVKGAAYQKNNVEEEQKVNLQDMYNDLLEIFPDANPEYLRTHAMRCLYHPEMFKQFVQNNLENRNYPTKEDYLKNMQLRQQLEQYITNFNVTQFLELFPNPFEFFENRERTSDRELSLNYLKKHYNRVRLDTIQRTFRKNNCNLSLTVKELDNVKVEMKSRRSIHTVATENIPFAQEVAFIRHRTEIREYIRSIEQRQKREYEYLKKNGGLLECQCCFNDELIPSKSSTCENGHIFCDSCIIRGTESKMSDGETHVKCFTDCDSEFPLSVLQKVLKPANFSILLTKRQEAEVKAAGLEGLVSCPFCHFASIPPPEDKVFKCLNQDCMKETCRTCKELNHVPLSCEEAKKQDNARHHLEEQMTEALIRICYQCKKPFFKEEGCNKMKCTCGATMCYICSQPIDSYNHFRGQGSDNYDLCPLYTDDATLNAQVVRRVAQKTAKDLMAKDPRVKLDTEKLMPVLPPPRRGPHENMGPMNLPDHALRARPYTDNH